MGGTNGVAICCYDSWNGVCFCLMYAGGLLGRLNVVACGAVYSIVVCFVVDKDSGIIACE